MVAVVFSSKHSPRAHRRRLQRRATGRIRLAARSDARQSPASTVAPVEVTGLETDGDRDHNDRNPLPDSVTYLGGERRTRISLRVRYSHVRYAMGTATAACYFFARVRYRPKHDECAHKPKRTPPLALVGVRSECARDDRPTGETTKHMVAHVLRCRRLKQERKKMIFFRLIDKRSSKWFCTGTFHDLRSAPSMVTVTVNYRYSCSFLYFFNRVH